MDSFTINTTHNVEISYELAGVGDRAIAAFIDLFIQIGYAIFIYVLNGILNFGQSLIFLNFLVFAPIFAYEVLLESSNHGQTFGKYMRNIRVVDVNGGEPAVNSIVIRWLFRLFEISMCMGSIALITFIINGKGQRLGDIAAKTTVVKSKKPVKLEETILTKVEDDYKPLFPEAKNLTGKDVEIIKEVLKTKPEEDRHGILKHNLIKKTKNVLQKKLKIESDLEPHFFLRTIIKDYNYLNRTAH